MHTHTLIHAHVCFDWRATVLVSEVTSWVYSHVSSRVDARRCPFELNLCCSLAVVVGRCLGAHSLTLTLTHLSVLATTNSTQSNAAPIHRRFHHTRIHTHTYTHSCHLHKNTNTTRTHSTFNEAWQESDRRLRDLAALEADPEQKQKPADRNASIEYVTVHSAST